MPNLIIETSHASLISQPDELLHRINQSLWQSGCFTLIEDIKTRFFLPNSVLIGTEKLSDERFVFVHFYLMSGRDKATIDDLTQRISDSIQQYFVDVEKISDFSGRLQICVNPMILGESYRKVIW